MCIYIYLNIYIYVWHTKVNETGNDYPWINCRIIENNDKCINELNFFTQTDDLRTIKLVLIVTITAKWIR